MSKSEKLFLQFRKCQATAISRLLLVEPRMLIMDEPMAALGVDEGRKVLDLVVTMRSKGLASLLVSHTLEHVLAGRPMHQPSGKKA